MSRALSDCLGLPVIETDPLFRKYRAIPINSDQPEAVIIRGFLDRIKREHPDHYCSLKTDAQGAAGHESTILSDGKRFRQLYGESIFRLFETEMLRWLFDGTHSKAIPDLSASAPLYGENQRLFSRSTGFLTVLLDTPQLAICTNLINDYLRYRATPGKIAIRGAYEMAFDAALRSLGKFESSSLEWIDILHRSAQEQTESESEKRIVCYRSMADRVLVPAPTDSPQDLAARILPWLAPVPEPQGAHSSDSTWRG